MTTIRAVTRRELDQWIDGQAAMHGTCHPRSEQIAFYMGGIVAIRCRTCNKHVVNVALDPAVHESLLEYLEADLTEEGAVRVRPSCHPRSGLHLAYSGGAISAICGMCKESVQIMPVRESPEDPQ